jgi:L-amino acid N-acyltransferase YncA
VGPWLVGEHDGRVIGYAYASAHRVRAAYRWSVDTSVYVDVAYRRRRVALALYTSLLGIVSAQGHFNAYRNVGYKLEQWHDVGWWQLELQVHRTSPPPPVGIGVLRQQPSWLTLLAAGVSVVRLESDDVSAT